MIAPVARGSPEVFNYRPVTWGAIHLSEMGWAAGRLAGNRVMATRCMPVDLQRSPDRAPPARRIAGNAGSHICCNAPWPVRSPLSAFGCSAMYRVEAVGLGGIPSRTNKAVNYGLTDIGTLQQMWEPALPAMRRAGGARSQGRQRSHDKPLSVLMRSTDGPFRVVSHAPAAHTPASSDSHREYPRRWPHEPPRRPDSSGRRAHPNGDRSPCAR